MAKDTTTIPQKTVWDANEEAEEVFHAPIDDADYIDLFDAAKDGDISRLDQVLKNPSIKINARHPVREDSRAALQIAASNGHADAVQLLLDHGADMSQRGSKGISALVDAASGEHVRTVATLLDAGAKENLQLRCERISWEREIFYAFRNVLRYKTTVNSQAIATLELLLDAGADVNAPLEPNYDDKLIHTAASLKSIKLIEFLIDRGALLPSDIIGQTDNYDMVNFLLELATKAVPGCSLDIISGLRTAACAGNLQTVRLLLMYADEADIRNNQGMIVRAAVAGHVDVVDCLIDHGFHVDASSDERSRARTPLIAVCHGNDSVDLPIETSMVSRLIERGADVTLQDLDGNTALHFAAYWGTPAIIQILLDAGADPSIQNRNGNTPLIRLCSEFSGFTQTDDLFPRIESLKLITRQMKNVNAQNDKKDTALHTLTGIGRARPIISDHFNGARLLIEKGADLNIRNNYGWTPGDIFKAKAGENVFREYAYGTSPYRYVYAMLCDIYA
ncbi:MAG: hypothetical protein Q9216_003399 [Gyalolechia sp. 2 TL-2023]